MTAPSQPTQPAGTGVNAQAVVDELSRIHSDQHARMAVELAQMRALVAQQDDELRYLRSLQPGDAAAG